MQIYSNFYFFMRFFVLTLFLLLGFRMAFAVTDFSEERALTDLDGIIAVDSSATEGDMNNQLATSICQLILFLNGRTGRAVAVIAIFALAFLFMISKLSVSVFLTFIIGIALLFGAKSIALILLPSYVTVKDPDRTSMKKTPEELVKEVCPELK